ncbi:MAG: chemotaxis protein CheX [Nitrospina sp.]|jgi:chemotaxis protein CheX|nr:chemotaxis protein CheX [Nitrospina sp.]MBT3414843.1 chemotaxis protein CheX [Nitrospina sp.]MBT4105597.1 chemotaxis protein CheX [Nitrospina sp.]MBT4390249.1 chemotaxis protein CheX [Nitrospina sp.]MBT4621024.1 chemotaxis protein CheX [Nitrospina sp.]
MATINFSDGKMPSVLTDVSRDSILSIFNTIFGAEPKFEGGENGKSLGDGVVGIISFMGDVNYIIMLALPKDSAIAMASKFCGFDIDYDSPDMGDVVGELANVLAGDIVARMSKEDFKVTMSLPTIMRGHDVEPLLPRGLPLEKLSFSMAEGHFMLKVAGAKSGELVGRKPGS